MSNSTADNQEAEVQHAAPDDDLAAQRRSEQAGKLVMSARLALRREQRAEAKKLLAQALKVDATDIGALELLGDIFMEDAEQEKALQVFEHGLKHHPEYAPFEEKLAQAHLDIAEMENDKLLKESATEAMKTGNFDVGDKLLDRKPALAMGLSVFVPGAGQVYNEEYEKAAMFFGLALLSLLGWFNTLFNKMRSMQDAAQAQGRRAFMPNMDEAISAMSSGQRTLFWGLVMVWTIVTIVAAVDATISATRFNEARRQHLGL
jgi:hypothetical protein